MRYLRKSMAFEIRQTWVRTLAQPHPLCGLSFILVSLLKVLLPAFIPSSLPTTNFPFTRLFSSAQIPSQTNLSLCLTHPFHLPPHVSPPFIAKLLKRVAHIYHFLFCNPSTLDGLSSAPTSLSCSIKVILTLVCCWLQQTLLCPPIIWLLSSIFNSRTLLPAWNTLLPWHPSHPLSGLLWPLSHSALVGLLVSSPLPGIECWGP